MFSFGPYKISPTGLRCSKENRWNAIECIDKAPLLQNIGQGVENIDLEGIIYPNNSNSLNQLKNLKESIKNQVSYPLVDNTGNFLGQFVITKLEEKHTYFLPNGMPKKVEFSLILKRYV